MITGIVEALPKRKIDSDTCQKFKYESGTYEGTPVQIANYYDSDYNKVAQKLRFADKTFKWLGDADKITLYGQNLWRDGGRTLIITEGEIDLIIFLRDPLGKHPHDVDISMLMRLCDVHEVPLATNYKSAHIMVKYFKNKQYDRI